MAPARSPLEGRSRPCPWAAPAPGRGRPPRTIACLDRRGGRLGGGLAALAGLLAGLGGTCHGRGLGWRQGIVTSSEEIVTPPPSLGGRARAAASSIAVAAAAAAATAAAKYSGGASAAKAVMAKMAAQLSWARATECGAVPSFFSFFSDLGAIPSFFPSFFLIRKMQYEPNHGRAQGSCSGGKRGGGKRGGGLRVRAIPKKGGPGSIPKVRTKRGEAIEGLHRTTLVDIYIAGGGKRRGGTSREPEGSHRAQGDGNGFLHNRSKLSLSAREMGARDAQEGKGGNRGSGAPENEPTREIRSR